MAIPPVITVAGAIMLLYWMQDCETYATPFTCVWVFTGSLFAIILACMMLFIVVIRRIK